MLLKYNTEKLKKIIYDFHAVTEIPASVLDVNKNYLVGCTKKSNRFCAMVHTTPEGRRRCRESDVSLLCDAECTKCAVTHHCHAGFRDSAVPIYIRDTLVGFVIFGQVDDGEGHETPFDEIYEKVKDLGLDKSALREAYESIQFFDNDKITSAAEIVSLLTKYILFENIIEPQYESDIQNIVAYISENLSERLTVSDLCQRFLISKNTLYKIFSDYFHCSVKDYVNSERIENAAKLLRTTDLSVREIGERCGIDNYQYFCRLFKQKKELTPLQFRKVWEAEQKHKNIT